MRRLPIPIMLPKPVVTCPVIGYTMLHDQKFPAQRTGAILPKGLKGRDPGKARQSLEIDTGPIERGDSTGRYGSSGTKTT